MYLLTPLISRTDTLFPYTSLFRFKRCSRRWSSQIPSVVEKLILRIPGVGIALQSKVPPGGMTVNALGSDEGLREDNTADVWSTCGGRKCLCLCFHARKWLGCERLDILHGFVSERS